MSTFKPGFLLVELTIGLLVSTVFILIITHYIIEVKTTQQKAIIKMESFSIARNDKEKAYTKNKIKVHEY